MAGMRLHSNVTQRRFSSGPGLEVVRGRRSGLGLGSGTGARLPSRSAELRVVVAGLIAWFVIVFRVGLMSVGPKAFALAVAGPLVLMFFALVALEPLGPRFARLFSWAWMIAASVVAVVIWL